MSLWSICSSALLAGLLATSSLGQEAPRLAGSEVERPKRTKFANPEYPPEARVAGARGIVILEIVIDAQGRVSSVEVVRSVPPFDEAAMTAVRQWEYEVTRVDGRPVPVRLTVPITFALKLPDLSREEGIPALRQGAAPSVPADAGTGEATASVTLSEDGQVVEAVIEEGESPWAEALLIALRSWRFAVIKSEVTISFRVHARFVSRDGHGDVELRLTDMSRTAEPSADASSAPPSAEVPQPPSEAAAEAEADEPAEPPAQAQAPDPAATTPDAGPPVEVIASPILRPAATPEPTPPPLRPGTSSVRDVSLGMGVPDLVAGRRPVVPPLARMASVSGSVEVRFSVDAAGGTKLQATDGPELLEAAAQAVVDSWKFQRQTANRIYLNAVITYLGHTATASVAVQE
jgi:TonB family protein